MNRISNFWNNQAINYHCNKKVHQKRKVFNIIKQKNKEIIVKIKKRNKIKIIKQKEKINFNRKLPSSSRTFDQVKINQKNEIY